MLESISLIFVSEGETAKLEKYIKIKPNVATSAQAINKILLFISILDLNQEEIDIDLELKE